MIINNFACVVAEQNTQTGRQFDQNLPGRPGGIMINFIFSRVVVGRTG